MTTRTHTILLLAGITLMAAGLAIAAFVPYPWGMLGNLATIPGGLIIGSTAYTLWNRRHATDD